MIYKNVLLLLFFLLNRVLLELKALLAPVVKKEREGPLVNLDPQALQGLQG